MSYKVLIHLLTILITVLAVSSANLKNASFSLQREQILQRIRRDIYADQYEDEYKNIDDGTVRRSLSSLRFADENSEEEAPILQFPAKRNFVNDLVTENYYFHKNSYNRRNLPPGGQTTSTEPSSTQPSKIVITNFTNPWGLVYNTGGNVNNHHPKKIIITLLIAYQLRENLLYMFGCLLQRPVDFLTEPQYTSLHTLYTELLSRPSTTQLLLKELKNVPTSNLNEQTKSIMQILQKVLPPYVGCAAHFWIREIEEKRINLNSMPLNTCPSNFNILHQINVNLLNIQTIMKPMDAPTRMTEYVLGKMFVKILYDIQKFKVVLSQAVFGIILANFPKIPYDPVLDENIRYILQITLKAEITGWQEIELQPVTGEPYRFIKIIIAKILVIQNVPRPIKEALTYIRIHLRPVTIHHMNPDYPIMQKLDDNAVILESLLSFIVPNAYSPETICLKDRFLEYVQEYSFHQSWLLSKTDRLRYTNSHDLLLAYLTKLQRHIPNPDSEKARTVTALLSVLIIDKQNKQFTPVSKNIDFLSILGYLTNPDFPPNVNKIYNKVLQILLIKPDLQSAITKLVPTEKGKCIVVDECLKQVLQNVDKMNLEIPRRMEKLITEIYDIIPIKATNPKCKTNPLLIKMNQESTISGNKLPDKPLIVDNGDNDDNDIDGYDNSFGSGISNGNGNGDGDSDDNDSGFRSLTDNADGNKNRGRSTIIIKPTWITNILLPPMMSATQDITIYINNKGAPAVDCPNITLYPGNPKVSMPPVVIILKPPEVADPFGSMNSDFHVNILTPIIQILGSSDLTPILGTSVQDLINSGKFPTTGALVVTLLEKAKLNPLVKSNPTLLININTYISGLDLIAVITLPIVLKVTKLHPSNGIIYSIINIAEPHTSSISVNPPLNVPKGMLVFVIMDPNTLREPVDPLNPYEGLLPNVDIGSPGGQYISQLRIIFTTSKISQLIPNFKPQAYPNKGFLLMVLLQKLPKAPEIMANSHLKKIIIGYIWAIMVPAFYTKVSYPDVLNVLGHQPQVKPDTTVLVNILPPPKNGKEKKMFRIIKILLEREDLFEVMLIPKPTPNTSQKELLKIIILGVLSSSGIFDQETLTACNYYKNKIFDIKKGNSKIVWEFEDRKLITLSAPLGQIIENVINYDKLSNENKIIYNDLLKYFAENRNIFGLIQDFPITKYKTEGTFLKGLFEYLLENSIISQEAKNKIKTLSSYVMLNGPGVKPLQLNSQGNPSSARRSLSKFEINV